MNTLARRSRFAWRTYRLEISNAIEYRGSLLGWVLLAGAPLLAHYILWHAIFSTSQGTIAGLDFANLITYQFLAVLIFQVLGPWSLFSAMSDEIRLGEINRYLIRPIPYRLYRAIRFSGYNTVFLSLSAVPATLMLFALGDNFIYTGSLNLLYAFAAFLLAAALQFLSIFCFAMLAFWFDDMRALFMMYSMLLRFAVGEMFPLELLPATALELLQYSPFPYIVWFPLQLYLGRLDIATMQEGFLVSSIWVVALWLLGSLMWKRGLKKFGAFGG